MAHIAPSSFGRTTWPRRAPRVGLTSFLQISNEPAVLARDLLNEEQKVSSTLSPIERPASPRPKIGARSDRHHEEIILTMDALAGGFIGLYPVFRREAF